MMNKMARKKKKSTALKAMSIKDIELEDKECQSKNNEFMEFTFLKLKEFLKHEE